ncbi:MAG: hypothetical protein ACRC8A_19890, partial [Microcoleaceae cyanobacterium]
MRWPISINTQKPLFLALGQLGHFWGSLGHFWGTFGAGLGQYWGSTGAGETYTEREIESFYI